MHLLEQNVPSFYDLREQRVKACTTSQPDKNLLSNQRLHHCIRSFLINLFQITADRSFKSFDLCQIFPPECCVRTYCMDKILFIIIPVRIVKFQNCPFIFDRIRIPFSVTNQSVFRQRVTVKESNIKGERSGDAFWQCTFSSDIFFQ